MSKISFPQGFVWGAATASHQVEGGTVNDWSEWEPKNAARLAAEAPSQFSQIVPDWNLIQAAATDPQNYISGRATDHYHLYKEDIALMRSLGIKAYRFSIEWSRIEPARGKWDDREIQHYADVLAELRRNDIEPYVTLMHNTIPVWVAANGGWANYQTVKDFGDYAAKVAGSYPEVKFWMPLNEPNLNYASSYIASEYPPQQKNILTALKVLNNFAAGHNLAAQVIRQINSAAKIGVCVAAIYSEAYKNRWYNRPLVALVDHFSNFRFIDKTARHTDFIGIQYYRRGVLNLFAPRVPGNTPLTMPVPPENLKNDMGWEIYPRGIYLYIKKIAARYPGKQIYITENGIADARDQHRVQYIKEHLAWIHSAIGEGIDIRGYFYWSLLDNFEWNKGYWPRFGLIEVDYKTLRRSIRPSAKEYARIIAENGIDSVN